jgi:hypothetical protein
VDFAVLIDDSVLFQLGILGRAIFEFWHGYKVVLETSNPYCKGLAITTKSKIPNPKSLKALYF